MDPERHQQVMSILADAMDCDTGEREQLLAQSCGKDESLRLEIERLLRHETSALHFIEESLLNSRQDEDSVIGMNIGPYRLIHEIGCGGMGAVYLAVRSDDEYQRQVAIKLIKRGMDSDLIQRRFRNERQILANLDHQNIARLFDGGTTEDGRAYLVMEYIDGEPIDAYADRHRLSITERLKLFLAVCDAVEYAHQNQVVHRDLKPGNILVNRAGTPKLLDFGIAKILNEETPGATTLTWRVLTPEYASPEQIRGEHSGVTSDVYSLGAVLYELLTGHRNRRARSQDVTLEPERPSAVVVSRAKDLSETRDGSPERLRRSLRGDLDNIVLMALRSEPLRRYPSVKDFANDIRRHLDGQPVRARKDSPIYRGRKFVYRNRTSVLSATAVAVLCLMVGLSLYFFMQPRRTVTSIGVLPFYNVGQDQQVQYLSDGLTQNLIGHLSRLPQLKVPGYNSVSRYEEQSFDPVTAARQLSVNTLMLGRVNVNGETLSISIEIIDAPTGHLIWRKRFDGKVADILTLQQQIAVDVTQGLGLNEMTSQTQRPTTTNPEAYRLYLRADHFWNLRTDLGLGKAVELFQSAIEHDPNYALAHSGLSKSYGLLGAYRFVKPDEIFPVARASALRALELDSNLAEAHTSLAFVKWLYEWDWKSADQSFRRAIELRPNYVMAHHWYGLFLAEMGRFDEALASEQRALELDPLSLYVTADLGRVYYYMRRYDEALVQYRRAIEMNPNYSGFYSELAQLYEQTGEFELYLSTLYPRDAVVKPRVQLFRERGRQGYWRQTWLNMSTAAPLWNHYYELALICVRLGKKDQAFENLNRAYEVRDHFMTQLKVEPTFDSLRSDPRFAELLRRMNLHP